MINFSYMSKRAMRKAIALQDKGSAVAPRSFLRGKTESPTTRSKTR